MHPVGFEPTRSLRTAELKSAPLTTRAQMLYSNRRKKVTKKEKEMGAKKKIKNKTKE